MNAVTEVMDELRKALAELEDCRARNADLRTMLEQVTRERDEARTSCSDCAMWAERSTRWHDDMQRAERERERDEARAEVADAYRRGAEAMREACARWFREHDESFELTVDACHDVIVDMPIPEDK